MSDEDQAEWREMAVHYPFPLSDGTRARLVIPRDLTAADAERLATFVRSLAAVSSAEPTEETG